MTKTLSEAWASGHWSGFNHVSMSAGLNWAYDPVSFYETNPYRNNAIEAARERVIVTGKILTEAAWFSSEDTSVEAQVRVWRSYSEAALNFTDAVRALRELEEKR